MNLTKKQDILVPIKPLERQEVEQALALDTKTMKDNKKKLCDYAKLKRFKVSTFN